MDNHCVYIFNEVGEQIHKLGKEGQGIEEFYCPFWVVLDNTGQIVAVLVRTRTVCNCSDLY